MRIPTRCVRTSTPPIRTVARKNARTNGLKRHQRQEQDLSELSKSPSLQAFGWLTLNLHKKI
jgi:hypothetical protein